MTTTDPAPAELAITRYLDGKTSSLTDDVFDHITNRLRADHDEYTAGFRDGLRWAAIAATYLDILPFFTDDMYGELARVPLRFHSSIHDLETTHPTMGSRYLLHAEVLWPDVPYDAGFIDAVSRLLDPSIAPPDC